MYLLMKQYFLPVLLLLCAGNLFSQNKLGIATYTVPFGWQSTQQASSIVLENKKSKGALCRITIYGTENTAVTTANAYLQYRAGKNGTNARFNASIKQVVKTESNGNTCFSSVGTGTVNEREIRIHFYSFTNGSETFFVELLTGSNECTGEFNQFLTTLLMDPASEPSGNGGTQNTRKKKKAAPAAAPAAPAPMM